MWDRQSCCLSGTNRQATPESETPDTPKLAYRIFNHGAKPCLMVCLQTQIHFCAAGDFEKSNQGFFFFPFLEVFTITDSKVWLRHTLHKVKLSPLSPSELFSTNISSYFFLPNPFTSTWVIASLSDSDTAKWSDLLISLKDCSRHSSI